MENFAIDLDKVLDEFELNEDHSANQVADKKYCFHPDLSNQYDSALELASTLNLEEADFGPSAKTANSITSYNSNFYLHNGHASPDLSLENSKETSVNISQLNTASLNGNLRIFLSDSDFDKLSLLKKDHYKEKNDDGYPSLPDYKCTNQPDPQLKLIENYSLSICNMVTEHVSTKGFSASSPNERYSISPDELCDPKRTIFENASSSSSHTLDDCCRSNLPYNSLETSSLSNHTTDNDTSMINCKKDGNVQMPLNNFEINASFHDEPSTEVNRTSQLTDCSDITVDHSDIENVKSPVGFGDLDDISVSDIELEAYFNVNVDKLVENSNKELAELDIYLKPMGNNDASEHRTGTKPKQNMSYEIQSAFKNIKSSQNETNIPPLANSYSCQESDSLDSIKVDTETLLEDSELASINNVNLEIEVKCNNLSETETKHNKVLINDVDCNYQQQYNISEVKANSDIAITWNDIKLDLTTDTMRLNITEHPNEFIPEEVIYQESESHQVKLMNDLISDSIGYDIATDIDNLSSESVVSESQSLNSQISGHNMELLNADDHADLQHVNGSHLQKRPTSLNLPPRAEFNPNYIKNSLDSPMTPIPEDNQLDQIAAEISEPSESSTPTSQLPVLSEGERMLGRVPPYWIPDAEASNCMQCESRFTMIKRRHHCRACGKVLCSSCCSLKAKLVYMINKEARVCQKCQQTLSKVLTLEKKTSPSRTPNPNNPSEYCSTVPPLQQAQAALLNPPPTVMVPVGVLKREGSKSKGEPKQVMFSDGIRPGGDLTELDGSNEPRQPYRRQGRLQKKVEKANTSDPTQPRSATVKTKALRQSKTPSCFVSLVPQSSDQLPPIVISSGNNGEVIFETGIGQEKLMEMLTSDDSTPVVFAVNKNLFVLVKIIHLDCCVYRTCWCFTTKGMDTVGQDEIVIVLECLPDEKIIPRDIFCHFNTVYEEASNGNTVGDLSHTIFNQTFLDSRDHGGFLYVRPTFQCLHKLILPSPPFVVGILLQKWETPWVKVFPLRLLLRLGAEYRYYPCPLVSVRFRKPLFGEVGHTIMNLLADFRNYQYMLTCVKGVCIHMEDKKTYINFPKNRYDELMKVLNNSNEHVLAFGANFSMEADSHLVCVQNEEGNYNTQAINIQNKPRKVTGASFVVFSGALKSTSGLTAKSSIVEDGLMVQIFAECLNALKQALRDMREFVIECGPTGASQPDEIVTVRWVEDDKIINIGVVSPIDNMPMDGIPSIRIHNSTDYMGEHLLLRWTEVFFLQTDETINQSRLEPVDLSRLSKIVAQACSVALTGYLEELKKDNMIKIGLRVTMETDKVGYEIGSGGCKLPDSFMNSLDNELIPVIHGQDGSTILELIFHILEY